MSKVDLFADQVAGNPADKKLDGAFLDEGNLLADDVEVGDFDNKDLGKYETGNLNDGGSEANADEARQNNDIDDYSSEFDFNSLEDSNQQVETDDDWYADDDVTDNVDNDDNIDNDHQQRNPEESQTQNSELDQINKTLGTDFKSLEDAKSAIAGDKKESNVTALPKEIEERYTRNTNGIDYLNKLKNMSDKDLVMDDLKRKYRTQNNVKEIDQNDLYDLESKLESWELNGNLDIKADLIRQKIDTNLNTLKIDNVSIEKQKQDIVQKQNEIVINNYKNTMMDFAKEGEFYGAKLDKTVINEAYNDIISGKFFEEVQNNPREVAELALFRKFKEVIYKRSTGATYSDGVKAVFEEIDGGNKDPRTAQVRSSSHANLGKTDLKTRFLS